MKVEVKRLKIFTRVIDQNIVWQVWWDRASAKHANFQNYPNIASIIQLVEFLICNQVVVGSYPAGSSRNIAEWSSR